jgi:hypothetical protein
MNHGGWPEPTAAIGVITRPWIKGQRRSRGRDEALVAVVVQAAGQGQVVVRVRAVNWEMGMVTVVRLPGAVRLS